MYSSLPLKIIGKDELFYNGGVMPVLNGVMLGLKTDVLEIRNIWMIGLIVLKESLSLKI